MFDNGNFRRKRKRKADNVTPEEKPSPPSSLPSDSSSSEPSPKIPRIPCSGVGGDNAEFPSVSATPSDLSNFMCHLQDSLLPPTAAQPQAGSPSLYMQVPENTSPPPPPHGNVSSFSPGAVVPQWNTSSSSPPLYSSLHHSITPPPLFPISQPTPSDFSALVDPHACSPPLYVDLQTASCLHSEFQEAQQLLQLQAQCESLFPCGFSDASPLESLVLQQ